jgi:hypothetical protein
MEDQADSQAAGRTPAPTSEVPPAAASAAAPAPAPSGAAAGLGTTGISEAEWPAKVADTIEDVVEAVHDRVVRPLTLVARGIVFGIIIAVMALVLSVLAVIAVIRLLDVYAFGGRVWASDALLGALMVAAGAYAWTRRSARNAEER